MSIIAALLARIGWKVGGIAAVVALAGVSIWLLVAQIENRHLTSTNAKLDARINDPATGLVVQLAQSTVNTETLKTAAERTIASLRLKAAEDAAVLADTQRRLAIAQQQSVRAREQSAILLSTKPQGDTLEAQIRDIDARVLESLK